MTRVIDVEIAIVGAGIAGIATAYYLCKKYQCKSVLLIDLRDPMSYTSAQSGDNFRNWWPSTVMTEFSNDSISLMRQIARETSNVLQMKQRGYALATRRTDIAELVSSLRSSYSESDDLVRIHQSQSADAAHSSTANYFENAADDNWQSPIDGVDVLANKALIKRAFPGFSEQIENVLHIRQAGDFSSQQMGQYMLQQIKSQGGSRLRGQVMNITKGAKYQLEVNREGQTFNIAADKVVNAAGPYIAEIAEMLEVQLPVENSFQQKLAFEDHLAAVPRTQPFSIDIDQTTLDWNEQERTALADDPQLAWLAKPITGGIHCRPEGKGKWIKLGWAYNRNSSIPNNQRQLTEDARFDRNFPEVVMRGAARLNPNLAPYIDALPPQRAHYGGYYTLTKENWPLIGPLDGQGAFLVGALSGFGSMSACAAGSLCADWLCDGPKPAYAHALSMARYQDPILSKQLAQSSDTGIL